MISSALAVGKGGTRSCQTRGFSWLYMANYLKRFWVWQSRSRGMDKTKWKRIKTISFHLHDIDKMASNQLGSHAPTAVSPIRPRKVTFCPLAIRHESHITPKKSPISSTQSQWPLDFHDSSKHTKLRVLKTKQNCRMRLTKPRGFHPTLLLPSTLYNIGLYI